MYSEMDIVEKNYTDLYSDSDRSVMNSTEETRDITNDRLEEIINFARAENIKRIGIANCLSFQKVNDKIKKTLEDEGFVVTSVNCKLGKIPSSEFTENAKGVSCNPIGQAEVLEEHQTELNISIGLCIGHDILFNKYTKAPVTTLLVKDRKLKHKTIDRF